MSTTLQGLEGDLLAFLRVFEAVQQDVLFGDIGTAQELLARDGTPALARATAAFAADTAAPRAHALSGDLARALEHLRVADAAFRGARGAHDFGAAFVGGRRHQCRALELLYRHRHDLGCVAEYFTAADAGDDGTGDGEIIHLEANPAQEACAVFVPDAATRAPRPLVVCLHGAYGHGEEYLWSWLRPARQRGWLVLAPKSRGPTWSILQPGVDTTQVLAALDAVCTTHAVDCRRVLLSGLSDGATYSYLLGLAHADRFTALAPVAGVLPPGADTLLREGAGRGMPVHVVHGALDHIFPVATTRSTSALLEQLGYALCYSELPRWGHAYTGRINEDLLSPWFEACCTEVT